PLLDESGRVRFAINVFTDITAVKSAEWSQRFLAQAGALLASSLDTQATLKSVVDLAIPLLADWVTLFTLEGGRAAEMVNVHVDPARLELSRSIGKRFPP